MKETVKVYKERGDETITKERPPSIAREMVERHGWQYLPEVRAIGATEEEDMGTLPPEDLKADVFKKPEAGEMVARIEAAKTPEEVDAVLTEEKSFKGRPRNKVIEAGEKRLATWSN
jgi:hypothetical protein